MDKKRYLDAFLRVAGREVPEDLARWHATLEALEAEDTSDGSVYVTAVVAFRARQHRYRRRVWPSSHDATLQAGLFATTLVEHLLTTPPAEGSA